MIEQKSSSSGLDLDYFENSLLYNVLVGSTTTAGNFAAAALEKVSPDYFSPKNAHLAAVFRVVQGFYKERGEVPTHPEIRARCASQENRIAYNRVCESLNGGGFADSPYNGDDLIQNTERWVRQRIVEGALASQMEQRATKGEFDISAMVSELEEGLSVSFRDDYGMDYLGDEDDHLQRISAADTFMSTGIAKLDSAMGGGLITSDLGLYVFSGQTNIGKSMIAGNVAANVLDQHRNVLVISFEMSERNYAKRFDALIANVPINELGERAGEAAKALGEYSTDNRGRLIIKQFPPSAVTSREVAAYIKGLKIHKDFTPDVIVLDYMTLMLPSKSIGNMGADGMRLSEEVRGLSYIFGCPVITPAQLKKDIRGERPTSEDVGSSYGIAQTADFVLALYQNDDERQGGVINYRVTKSRFGGRDFGGSLFVDYSTLRVSCEDSAALPIRQQQQQQQNFNSSMTDFIASMRGK